MKLCEMKSIYLQYKKALYTIKLLKKKSRWSVVKVKTQYLMVTQNIIKSELLILERVDIRAHIPTINYTMSWPVFTDYVIHGAQL